MVYVTPAEDYEQALDYAYSEFPEELNGVSRDRVRFSIKVLVDGKVRSSRIGRMAWKNVLATLTRYELINIDLQSDEPPQYASDEKDITRLQPSLDCRAGSRSPSPSGKKGGARGWMEKFL